MSAVRRRLLAAIAQTTAVPLDVGFDYTALSPNDTIIARFVWSDANPLNATGTITSVRARFLNGGHTVAFAIISPTNVVRSIGTNVTSVVGDNTYTVSLAGQAGDYIGVWTGDAFEGTRTSPATGVSHYVNSTTTKPTAGDSRTRSSTISNTAIWIYGTG